MTQRACTKCGTALPAEARFCGSCGTSAQASTRKQTMIDGSVHVPHRPPRQAPAKDVAAAAPAEVVPAPKKVDMSKTLVDSAPGRNARADMMRTQLDSVPMGLAEVGDPEAQARARRAQESKLAQLDDWEPSGDDTTALAETTREEQAPATDPDPPAPVIAEKAGIPQVWLAQQTSPLSQSVASPAAFGAPAAPPIIIGAASGANPVAATDPDPPQLPPQPKQSPTFPSRPVPAGVFASTKKTMMGVSPEELQQIPRPGAQQAVQPAQQAAPLAQQAAPLAQTAAAPPAHEAAQPAAASTQPSPNARALRTMMGVAPPEIAPPQAAPVPADPRHGAARTMLGVAMPGIAPTRAGPTAAKPERSYKPPQYAVAAPLPDVVPAPAPLEDEPINIPMWRPKAGVPIVVVVGAIIVLVLVGGAVIAAGLFRRTTLTAAQPKLDDHGSEVMVVTCASCPDETTLSIGEGRGTVTGHAATIPLKTPLAIGDNELAVHIDRPGGSAEDVKLIVPIAYRIRADLSTLSAKPPVVTVRVEATLGTTVVVDGKPLAMDASGKGSYPVDVSEETVGPADEAKILDRKISFSITPKGGKEESGAVIAKAPVVVLHIDAPLAGTVVTDASVLVAGNTVPGGKVTLDGQPLTVDAKGAFTHTEPLPKMGESTFELSAHIDDQAPRRATLHVRRVASLDDAQRDADAKKPLSYAAFAVDTSKLGELAMIEGEVIEVRPAPGQSVYLVANRPGCNPGVECLVRVVEAGDVKLQKKEIVRVYGHVSKPVTSGGHPVPELLADFHVPARHP